MHVWVSDTLSCSFLGTLTLRIVQTSPFYHAVNNVSRFVLLRDACHHEPYNVMEKMKLIPERISKQSTLSFVQQAWKWMLFPLNDSSRRMHCVGLKQHRGSLADCWDTPDRRGLLSRQQPGHMCVQRHRGCWELRWLLTWTSTTYGGKGPSDIYTQDWGQRSEHRAPAVSIEGGQRSLEECLGTTLPLSTNRFRIFGWHGVVT